MTDNVSDETDGIEQLGHALKNAERVLFFTGAGISTESGIADFRSPGGIWSQIKPIQFQNFLSDEEARLEDWRRRFRFQAEFDAAPLNLGHDALAKFMQRQNAHGLITQNIDGLHQRSGIMETQIVEIHGNGNCCFCLECGSPMPLKKAESIIDETGQAPRCLRCEGLVKSGVISFGQPMPQAKLVQAEQLSKECDLFIVLGSSLVVQPASRLPVIAVKNGAILAIVNREPTPLDDISSIVLRTNIGETLQKVLENVSSVSPQT